MNPRQLGGTLVLLLAVAASAHAAKTQVEVVCKQADGDSIGMQLCSALRDVIAASPRYEYVENVKTWHWFVSIVSTTDDGNNLSSAQSVVFATGTSGVQFFIDHLVLVTGQTRINYQAHSILAALDEDVGAFNTSK